MRIIKEFDYKDYKENGTVCERTSVRGIIVRKGKLAMVYSEVNDFYSFAGGGIEEGESHEEALCREICEELGLEVIPESVREYGLVTKKEKGRFEDIFIQNHYYYFCDVKETTVSTKLENYEEEAHFVLKWVTPSEIIETNRTHKRQVDEFWGRVIERETWLTELLLKERM